MGVFDFVREAGSKVGIGDSKEEREEKAVEAEAEVADEKATAARQERVAINKKSRGLEKYVKDLGLKIDDLDVEYDDGTAKVSGSCADQETREKVILAIGNCEGVAKVDDSIKVTAESAESKLHTVVSGDTLSKIAQTVYGDASKYPAIFEANKPMLKDPDLIYPGQVLRIPEQG